MTVPGTLWARKAIQPRASPFGTGTGERIEQLASARGCADSVENVIIAWSAVEKKRWPGLLVQTGASSSKGSTEAGETEKYSA